MLDIDVINPRVCLILPKYWYVLRVFYTFIFLPRSNPIEMNELLTKRYNNDMFRGTFTVPIYVHEVSVWLMIIDSWSRVFYPWKGSLKNITLDARSSLVNTFVMMFWLLLHFHLSLQIQASITV